VSRFDGDWGRKWHQHVLLLVRDIANPSNDDMFFPTWRHKDWYLGFSWASGVVTINGGQAYPNGRNQESVSEAIHAYEAVALYGEVMSDIFRGSTDKEDLVLYDNALRIRDMGRLLACTEVRSAKTYWQVRSPDTPGVSRIYPEIYQPKIVGMIWSMMVQEQTWFGNEEWKSYGIQLMPLTPLAELRDNPAWMKEMLPVFQKSCESDPKCQEHGWSILLYSSMATIGNWKEAWEGVKNLEPAVFDGAGGNGHSLTNTLWYISTRPEVNTSKPNW
jgi:endoglucanase Acf2